MADSSTIDAAPIATREIRLHRVQDALTPRTVACAVVLGSALCLANTYFGLQAGVVSSMPMQSALLGFSVFASIRPRLSKPLSPGETTLIEIIAGALGLAPFTSGLTSFIPALEFLTTPEESGPTRFGIRALLLWSIATCGLGIVAGAPLRSLFILREQLRYPSATATGTLIGILFRDGQITARAKPAEPSVSRLPQPLETGSNLSAMETETRNEGFTPHPDFPLRDMEQDFTEDMDRSYLKILLYSLIGSVFFVGRIG